MQTPCHSPEDVYMCQVSETVSCGACCGLYNVRDASRKALDGLLAERAERYLRVPRDPESILDYIEQVLSEKTEPGPLAEFHHCPFLGLIGDGRSRVGCLLHPASEANKGLDYRGLSYYGGMACRMYFCPTHTHVSPAIRRLIRDAAVDWYDYGMIVTETVLINAFFAEVERRKGRRVCMADSTGDHAALQEAVRAFIAVKINGPQPAEDSRKIVHYFFDDGLYPRPPVDYSGTGVDTSRYDVIFQELQCVFTGKGELERAESVLEEMIANIAYALPSP